MNARFAFVFALAAACGSSNNNTSPDGGGPTITPSVSIAEPSVAFLGRTLDVHLAGYGTMWTDATTVDFGAGVTVMKVTAASDTGLTATINVANTAAEGPRDITVKDGNTTETYKASFTVRSPLTLGMIQGTFAQGSLSVLHVDDADHDNPFDSTQAGGGFSAVTYPNLNVQQGGGIGANTSSVSPFGADFLMFVDVLAPAQKNDLTILSGPLSSTTSFVAPGALNVQARMPIDLAMGDTTGMVTTPYDSTLYSFAPDTALTVHELALSTTSTDQNASPLVALLPKSGKWSDLTTTMDTTAPYIFSTKSGDPMYLVYWDGGGVANYSFKISRKSTAVTGAMEAEDNGTQAKANTLATLPVLVQNADLKMGTADQDWYKVVVSASDFAANKHIHVTTFGASPEQAVDVLQLTGGTNTTSINTPTGPLDNDAGVDIVDTLPAAGTYYIQIALSQGGLFGPPDPATSAYNLFVRLEP